MLLRLLRLRRRLLVLLRRRSGGGGGGGGGLSFLLPFLLPERQFLRFARCFGFEKRTPQNVSRLSQH